MQKFTYEKFLLVARIINREKWEGTSALEIDGGEKIYEREKSETVK